VAAASGVATGGETAAGGRIAVPPAGREEANAKDDRRPVTGVVTVVTGIAVRKGSLSLRPFR